MLHLLSLLVTLVAFAVHGAVVRIEAQQYRATGIPDWHLVFYHDIYCKDCKTYGEFFQQASEKAKKEDGRGNKLVFAEVDCGKSFEICQKEIINDFPCIMLYKNGATREFEGHLTVEDITNFANLQMRPVISELSEPALTEFVKSDVIAAVGFFEKTIEQRIALEVFTELATELNAEMPFAYTFDPSTISEFNVTETPSVFVIKQGEDNYELLVPNAETREDMKTEIKNFLHTYQLPLLEEIRHGNYEKYSRTGLPIGFLFVEWSDISHNRIKHQVREVAKQMHGSIAFGWVDADRYPNHHMHVGLKPSQIPGFGILDTKSNLGYGMKEEVSEATVQDFCQAYLEERIERDIKSEEEVPWVEGQVHKIVYVDFDSLALDAEKDVLVLFHATEYCAHCEETERDFDELAKIFQRHGKKIAIAKYDVELNDMPENVRVNGLPAIKLFKSRDNEIVDFYEQRTIPNLIGFINKNNNYKVTVEIPARYQQEDKEDKEEGHDEL